MNNFSGMSLAHRLDRGHLSVSKIRSNKLKILILVTMVIPADIYAFPVMDAAFGLQNWPIHSWVAVVIKSVLLFSCH